jgi:serine/threonine protein kinase
MILMLRDHDGTTRTVDLDPAAPPLVIGRDADLAQVAVLDPQLSRVHCRIACVDGRWQIEDLSSRNGTWIAGQRITRHELRPGDRARIGGTVLSLDDAPSGPDPLIGARIAGFAIEAPLGRGRYGAVYRGTQIALHRPVAIKILAERFARDPERVRAFLVEARRAGALNHPNLVQVHDVIADGARHLLVMELMTGSVGDLIGEHGPLDEETVMRILGDVSAALAFAEANRLVHRDVKPDNILCASDGTYKLADLGIAHQERIFGSPHYVAPEQARGGAIDGRADLYALGATAFHLLSGRPPFEGPTRDVVQAHLSTPPPDLRRLAPQVSQGMAQLVTRLLRKNPAERPRSASEVATMLERLAEGRPLVRRPIRRRRRG